LALAPSVLAITAYLVLATRPAIAAGDCTVSSGDLAVDGEEQALLNGINQYRQQNGVPPLALSATLNRSAAWMSRDMATKDYFNHTDSLGRGAGTRMTDCGFNNPYTWRGEAIAAGYQTADSALQGWKGSPPHNALLLDRTYVAAGLARAYDATAPYQWYWTLDVASAMDTPLSGSSGTLPPTPTSAPPTSVPPSPTTKAVNPPPSQTPLSAPAGGGSNGLTFTNPGFESGLSGWERPSWFASVANVENAVVHSGSTAFGFSGKASGPYVQQTAAASGGRIINVSGWVNVRERNSAMSGSIELVARNVYGGTIATYTVYSIGGTTNGWTQITNSQVMPSGTASVRLRVRFPTLDGTVYLDDFSVS
jgi:uncharacterized protein YkwD